MSEIGEKSENLSQEHNLATMASDKFIAEKQNKFTRAIGTVLRTASTELLTWFGAPLIPGGIVTAGLLLLNREPLSKYIAAKISPSLSAKLTNLGEGQLTTGINKSIDTLAGLGAGASIVGGITTVIGTSIGWQGAKHHEDTRKLFKWGKFAEFAGIAGQMLTGLPIYPITKAFSIGATFFSQLKRPGSF